MSQEQKQDSLQKFGWSYLPKSVLEAIRRKHGYYENNRVKKHKE